MVLLCKNCLWQGNFEETKHGCCPTCFQKLPELNIIKLDFIK